MGMQISRGVYPEVSPQGGVWTTAPPSGEVFRELARQQESVIVEGHLQSDHVHMLLSIPPSMRWHRWWGISKGRVRFTLPDVWGPRAEFRGEHFWPGVLVSTVGAK